MKIEKIKSKLKKVFNRVMGVLLPVATLLVSCDINALVVHAAENQTIISFTTTEVYESCTQGHIVNMKVSSDYELIGLMSTSTSGLKFLQLYFVGKGNYDTDIPNSCMVSDIFWYSSSKESTQQEVKYVGMYRAGGSSGKESASISMTSGTIKMFYSMDDVKAYVSNGGGKYDIIKPDTIDDGIKDSDIGYLHNLQMNQLQSGKQDENGIYERYSDRFTWDDTYPEYDSSYLIEVRGKCVVQTKGFLGLGKVKTYTSDIENIAKDISYNDLEWIVSSTDKYAPFNSFINEHMPTNLVMTGVYGMRDLYFRIYKWSEADDCYRYGPWVNMHFVDDDVWVSVDGDTTMGDFDEDGNFIVDPDSDYGTGKKNDVGVGVGDTEEDAKKDNDRRNEEKKNDDGKLDLSNSSLTDIWNWFTTSLWNLYNSLGFIPEFFQKIFSFLPTPIYVFLGIGIVIAIVLRVLGR